LQGTAKRNRNAHLPHGEAQLAGQLAQQQVVGQRLAHLHDAHDGGVDLMEPVLQREMGVP
jgi:hypothetical protein